MRRFRSPSGWPRYISLLLSAEWGENRVREHRNVLLAMGVVAALGLGACGDGDDRPLSKAEFIERGSAICREGSERIEAAASTAFAEQGAIPSAEEITKFSTGTVAPTIENEVERLSKLRPPEADEERVEEILEAGRNSVERVRQDPTILLSSVDDGFGRYRELATAYGLQNCGGSSESTRDAISGIVRES